MDNSKKSTIINDIVVDVEKSISVKERTSRFKGQEKLVVKPLNPIPKPPPLFP